jgi:chromosome segregation ATPase
MLKFHFRSRSPDRDRENDRARLIRIQEAVCSSIASAESELNGLSARLESARQSAAFLLSNLDYGGREETVKSQLKDVEGRLLVAEKRVQQLDNRIETLEAIENMVYGALQLLETDGSLARAAVPKFSKSA